MYLIFGDPFYLIIIGHRQVKMSCLQKAHSRAQLVAVNTKFINPTTNMLKLNAKLLVPK